METMTLHFYDRFIFLKNTYKRLKTPYIIIKCIGAPEGEKIELYTNGKPSGTHIVRGGKITICIERGNTYRLTSPNFPYGVRFSTSESQDNTNDILIYQALSADNAEIKNIYRVLETLCSKVDELEKEIASIKGYQTE